MNKLQKKFLTGFILIFIAVFINIPVFCEDINDENFLLYEYTQGQLASKSENRITIIYFDEEASKNIEEKLFVNSNTSFENFASIDNLVIGQMVYATYLLENKRKTAISLTIDNEFENNENSSNSEYNSEDDGSENM